MRVGPEHSRLHFKTSFVVGALLTLQCRALFETDATQCDANAECPSGFPICSAEHVCVRAPSGGAGGQAAGGRASSGGSLNAGGRSDSGGTLNEPGGAAGARAGGELGGAAGAPIGGAGGEPSSNPTVGPGSVDAVLGVMDADLDDTSAWLGRTVYASGTWNDGDAFLQEWSLGNFTTIRQNAGLLLNLTDGLPDGESWIGAASNSKITDRWDAAIRAMSLGWKPESDATLYVSFARDFNGGVTWQVDMDDADQRAGFKAASNEFTKKLRDQFKGDRRVRTVWCAVNAPNEYETLPMAAPDDVDVFGIFLSSDDPFPERGMSSAFDAVRALAEQRQKPIGICRWTAAMPKEERDQINPPSQGKIIQFVEQLGEFLAHNRGTGPGQVAFAIYDDGPQSCIPENGATYMPTPRCDAIRKLLSKASSP